MKEKPDHSLGMVGVSSGVMVCEIHTAKLVAHCLALRISEELTPGIIEAGSNAERIAACWNAFHGVPTKDIKAKLGFETPPKKWSIEHQTLSEGVVHVVYDENGQRIADYLTEERAELIGRAPETASERDRLRAVNKKLVRALENAITLLQAWYESVSCDGEDAPAYRFDLKDHPKVKPLFAALAKAGEK